MADGHFRRRGPANETSNPNFPAAAEARFSLINRVIDLIYKALAPVVPNDIIAGSSAILSFAAYSGVKPDGEYWVFLEVNEGSFGERPTSDGPDSIDGLMANTRNNPLEDLAVHLPIDLRPLRAARRCEAGGGPVPGRNGRRRLSAQFRVSFDLCQYVVLTVVGKRLWWFQ